MNNPYHSNDIIEMLLYSHLYTLMKLHGVRTALGMKHLIDVKLINNNALNDIMDYHAMYSEINRESFKHNDEMRKGLMKIIKELRNEIK